MSAEAAAHAGEYTTLGLPHRKVGFWTFSTNGVATAGMHGIPTIGFGPGHEHFAHAPNEQTEIEHLVCCTAFYCALVDTFAKE